MWQAISFHLVSHSGSSRWFWGSLQRQCTRLLQHGLENKKRFPRPDFGGEIPNSLLSLTRSSYPIVDYHPYWGGEEFFGHFESKCY